MLRLCFIVSTAAFSSNLSRLWLWDIHLASFVHRFSRIKATDMILLPQQTEIGPECTCRLYREILFPPLKAARFLLIFSLFACSFYSIRNAAAVVFILPYLHLDQSASVFVSSCYKQLCMKWTLHQCWPSHWSHCSVSSQGNLVAIKHVNKKRIELTRQVLLELKHVSAQWMSDCRIFVILLLGWAGCFVSVS